VKTLNRVTGKAFLIRAYARWLRMWGHLLFRRASHADVMIIAHRGASHAAPENTLAAVTLAWQQGADAIEVDVRLTGDRRIVIHHDPTTGRTAGPELIVATTQASDLRRLDVGSAHPRFKGERIPFLEEVLDAVPAGRKLFAEIKCGPEILPVLRETVTRSGKRSQVVLIGFDLATMKSAKEALPDIPVYWLCDKQLWRPSRYVLAARAKASGLDGLDVHWSGVTWSFAQAVRRAGLKLYAWTVDDPADAARLRAVGVDGITTNRPDLLVASISQRGYHDGTD